MAITISGQNNNDKILASDGVLDQISGFNVVGVMTATTFDVTTKHTANHIDVGSNIQLGNAGIITATTLIGNVTGNVNSTSNLLLQISGSEKFRVGNGGQFGIAGANYGTAGQVFTSGGSGSAPTWSTIASDKLTEGNTEAEVVDTGSDGHFKVTTEGTERFRVTSNGTVNIGDADHVDDEYLSSTLKIQKDQNSVTRFTMRNENSGAGSAAAVQIGASGNSWMLQCGSAANDSNAFTIRVDGTANGNTGTERFRIKTDGKVGVNTTGPSQQFTSYAASGYPVLANGPSNGIGLGGNGAIVFGTKDLGSYAPGILDASTLEFKISGTPRLNIDSSGRVMIGTTTEGQANADELTISFNNTGVSGGDQGRCGMTIRSGDNTSGVTQNGYIYFSDGTSGGNEYRGVVAYSHSDDSMYFSTAETERLRIDSSGIVESNSSISSTYSTTGSITPHLRARNGNGTDNIYGGIQLRADRGTGAASIFNIACLNTSTNFESELVFQSRNSDGNFSEKVRINKVGNMGVGVSDPKSKLHLGSTGDIRFGSQYGGFAHIMQQVQYAAGTTGTHWMFETNNAINWCFDGVLIVYGGGGSSYGGEITKITIVYGRENGANNSGDIWRNGTTSYNIETLGHAQVGLNPGAGSLTTSEDTAPDGAASQRSLFKIGWTQPAQGGNTTVWSKLHGTMYWGQGVGYGSVEVQDKDGNIFWNSNP